MEDLKYALNKNSFWICVVWVCFCTDIFLIPLIAGKGQLVSTKSFEGGLEVVFKKLVAKMWH